MFSNKETKGIFWYEIKMFVKEKSYHFLFQLKSIYKGQKFKIQILYNTYVLIFYCPNWIFGQDFFASIFETLSFENFWGPAHWLYWKHQKTASDSSLT